MNFVDIIIIVCILLGAALGFRNGVIKTLVQLIGFVLVLVLSYILKDYLADYLMSFMPFFNFAGFNGVATVNILIYQLISFIIVFIILYCILGIIVAISGLIEKILKYTIILALPSKILGAIVGALEGLVIAFIIVFILFHAGLTTRFVNDSKTGVILLERTPILGSTMASSTLAIEDILEVIKKYDGNKTETAVREINAQTLSILIHYNLISKEQAEQLIKDKKLPLDNVQIN